MSGYMIPADQMHDARTARQLPDGCCGKCQEGDCKVDKLDALLRLATDLAMALGVRAPEHPAMKRAADMGLVKVFACNPKVTP